MLYIVPPIVYTIPQNEYNIPKKSDRYGNDCETSGEKMEYF